MFPVFLAIIGVGVAALAVTWYAVVSAVEGYEDESGFHPVSRESKHRAYPEVREIEPVGSKDPSETHPCATVR